MSPPICSIESQAKARKASDPSGIISRPKTVDASNVMPICAACGKAVRVKHSVDAEGKKVRICGKCGAVLETKKKEDKKAKATVRKRTKKAEETPVEAPATEATAPATDATVTE